MVAMKTEMFERNATHEVWLEEAIKTCEGTAGSTRQKRISKVITKFRSTYMEEP